MSLVLREAKRLYNLGFVVHWLRPNSKIPVKSNWTGNHKDSWEQLKKEYRKGYNIGVRLGNESFALDDDTYLALLDVDFKSNDKEHQKKAVRWLRKNFGEVMGNTVETLSGRANGSRHIWMRIKKPMPSQRLYSSPDEVEVYMPSAKPNRKQIEILGEEKVKKGIRLRPAFEIDFMCVGKQVAMPPSIHPDTNKAYRYGRKYGDNWEIKDIKYVDIQKKLHLVDENKGEFKTENKKQKSALKGWKPIDVNIFDVQMKLSEKMNDYLFEGNLVEDNSAAIFSLSIALLKAGYSDDEIMSILTDKEHTYIGATSWQHSKATTRARAARWVRDYCLEKAHLQVDAQHDFDDNLEIIPNLSEEEAEKQFKSIKKEVHWTVKLERNQNNDKVKPTLKNVVLILTKSIAEDIFRRDLFAQRDVYGVNTPWSGKEGEIITDSDIYAIKMHISRHFGFEPNANIIHEAVDFIARENGYHPVRDMLANLPEWDGIERIDNAFKTYLGGQGPETYLKEASRKFFIALIARIYEPGIKFDHIVIFEGHQGRGKSTFGSLLAGRDWFSDSMPDLHDKDAALNLQGTWVQEMGELASLRRGEIETTKAFITRQVDKVRPPYGRRKVELYRQTVFFGTTNDSIYLQDKTGNRRFWPVLIDQLLFEEFKKDRDQLLAEAMFIWFNIGEQLWLSKEASLELESVHSDKMAEDEEDVMAHELEVFRADEAFGENKASFNFDEFKLSDLFNDFGPWPEEKPTKPNLMRAARILKKLGGQKVHKRNGKFWKL